jgi:hypothetical protein
VRVLALALGLFALSAVPLLHTADGGARSARPLVGPIQVTAANVSVTTRPAMPEGRKGDATEQVWSLRSRYGHEVGFWLMSCRWVSNVSRLCTTVVRMPLGQITVTGASPTPYIGTYAVVGGTGVYDGADGAADFTAIGRGKLILSITLT